MAGISSKMKSTKVGSLLAFYDRGQTSSSLNSGTRMSNHSQGSIVSQEKMEAELRKKVKILQDYYDSLISKIKPIIFSEASDYVKQ